MLKLLMLCVVLSIAACAGSGSVSRNPERTNEVIITFITKARAGFWREAMENVTPEERDDMMEDGHVMPEYKEAVARIRLSTIKAWDLGLDGKGRLVGIRDILDESNEMAAANAEKINIDPRKVEDLAAKQLKRQQEEEERRRKEREEEKEEEDSDPESFLETLLKNAPKDW